MSGKVGRLFRKLKDGAVGLGGRIREARQVEPQAFRSLAEEMSELADVAERLGGGTDENQQKVRRIKEEMVNLGEMVGQPEFRRLSHEKRMALRQSLMDSREQLIKVVQTAAPPTETRQ